MKCLIVMAVLLSVV